MWICPGRSLSGIPHAPSIPLHDAACWVLWCDCLPLSEAPWVTAVPGIHPQFSLLYSFSLTVLLLRSLVISIICCGTSIHGKGCSDYRPVGKCLITVLSHSNYVIFLVTNWGWILKHKHCSLCRGMSSADTNQCCANQPKNIISIYYSKVIAWVLPLSLLCCPWSSLLYLGSYFLSHTFISAALRQHPDGLLLTEPFLEGALLLSLSGGGCWPESGCRAESFSLSLAVWIELHWKEREICVC